MQMAVDDRGDTPNFICCLQGAAAKFHNDHGELENEIEEPFAKRAKTR